MNWYFCRVRPDGYILEVDCENYKDHFKDGNETETDNSGNNIFWLKAPTMYDAIKRIWGMPRVSR